MNECKALPTLAKTEQQEGNYLFDVPPEKIDAMKKYAVKLRKQFPQMKPDRLARKVAEYFRIKVVKEDETDSPANFQQATECNPYRQPYTKGCSIS